MNNDDIERYKLFLYQKKEEILWFIRTVGVDPLAVKPDINNNVGNRTIELNRLYDLINEMLKAEVYLLNPNWKIKARNIYIKYPYFYRGASAKFFVNLTLELRPRNLSVNSYWIPRIVFAIDHRNVRFGYMPLFSEFTELEQENIISIGRKLEKFALDLDREFTSLDEYKKVKPVLSDAKKSMVYPNGIFPDGKVALKDDTAPPVLKTELGNVY